MNTGISFSSCPLDLFLESPVGQTQLENNTYINSLELFTQWSLWMSKQDREAREEFQSGKHCPSAQSMEFYVVWPWWFPPFPLHAIPYYITYCILSSAHHSLFPPLNEATVHSLPPHWYLPQPPDWKGLCHLVIQHFIIFVFLIENTTP